MKENNPDILPVIAGPTAVGKTGMAVALAARRPIEIISADSMQVYRGLDAGTAKPSAGELAAAPHHLIDVADPGEKYDLARFIREANGAIRDIRGRKRIPLAVGGTGLYIKGLSQGIFDKPSRDSKIRAELEQRIKEAGAAKLHEELRKADPAAAERISPNDPIRVVRALEVFHVTGRPISQIHSDPSIPRTKAQPIRLAVLCRGREKLNRIISSRVEAMLANGWVEEVEALLESGLSPDLHCFKALGYRPIVRALRGEESFDGLAERIAQETRQFAKRQMTWFRAMPGALWIDVDRTPGDEAVETLEEYFFGR
jgi:tRNA dimethylallyltransferase